MHVRDGDWPGAVADVRGRHQRRGTAGGPGPRPGPVGPAGTGRRRRGRRPDALSDVLERDQRVPAGALGGVQPGPAPQDWQGLRPAVRGSAIPAAALEGGAGAGIGCRIDGRRSPARRAGWAGADSAGRPVRADAWAGARRMAPARRRASRRRCWRPAEAEPISPLLRRLMDHDAIRVRRNCPPCSGSSCRRISGVRA
jgi:hypothetical protein